MLLANVVLFSSFILIYADDGSVKMMQRKHT